MIEQVIKCERYKHCKSKIPYTPEKYQVILQQMPSTWLALLRGQQYDESKHFCSELCLTLWLQEESCNNQ